MSSATRSTSLPSSSYAKDGKTNSAEEQCAICLSEFEEGDQVSALPCSHLFHTECINRWLENSPKCPICRTNVHQQLPTSNYNEIGNRSGGIWESLEDNIGLPLEILQMFGLSTSDSSEDSDSDTEDSDSDSEDTDETRSAEDTSESDSDGSLEFGTNVAEHNLTDSSSDGPDIEDNTNSRASISESSSTSDTESDSSNRNSSPQNSHWLSHFLGDQDSDSESL